MSWGARYLTGCSGSCAELGTECESDREAMKKGNITCGTDRRRERGRVVSDGLRKGQNRANSVVFCSDDQLSIQCLLIIELY